MKLAWMFFLLPNHTFLSSTTILCFFLIHHPLCLSLLLSLPLSKSPSSTIPLNLSFFYVYITSVILSFIPPPLHLKSSLHFKLSLLHFLLVPRFLPSFTNCHFTILFNFLSSYSSHAFSFIF